MPTEKRVPSLIVNTLTEAQYQALENPSDTEMWVTPYDESILPDQTGHSGKFLTTNGTTPSWAGLPDISGKANVSLDNLSSTGQGKFDAKVSKTGDTMTGALTINKAQDHIRSQDTVLDVNTTPSSNLNGGYYSITDKNNNLITRLYASNTTDGYNMSALQVRSGTSANTSASIGIMMKQDGTSAFAFCPTPSSDSNANHIATTAWVRAKAWSFPSTTYDEITVGASQATYTAQYDGWLFLTANVNSSGGAYLTVSQEGHADQEVWFGSAYQAVYLFTPINAGNYSIVYGNITLVVARLFRAKRYV